MNQANQTEKPLRFVVLCDSLEFERWQAACLRDTMASGLAMPVGLVMRTPPPAAATQSKWKKRWKARKLAVWRLYDRFYTRRFSQAIIREDMAATLGDLPRIKDIPVKSGKVGEALDDATIAFIRDLAPDFILRFSYGILRGAVLDAARYGVWSFHHGDPEHFRGQPPGFWEIANGAPVTGAILQVLSNELDAGKILHRGWYQTYAQSYARTRDALYMGGSGWIARAAADIRLNGWPPAEEPDIEKHGPIYKQPTNGPMIGFLWTTVKAFMRAQITYRLYRQNWDCALIQQPIAVVAGLEGPEKQRAALQAAQWMNPPNGQFYADPFGIPAADGKSIRVFFELFRWKELKGEIATVIHDGNAFGSPTPSLITPTHLSYPYVLHGGDAAHIVPEHSAARDVASYHIDENGAAQDRAPIFPDSDLIDTSFVEWNGKCWAFAMRVSHRSNTDLHVYFADSMAGPWTAHPLNPVKNDVRSARPAGTPFVHQGKLYRPAQDCATHYGSAITVHEVTKLSETAFQEIAVSRVEPLPGSRYAYGLHTLSQVGGATLIDGSINSRR